MTAQTITKNLVIVSTSLNTPMASGNTPAVQTLVVTYGDMPLNSTMMPFNNPTITLTNPSSDDLAAYAPGKELVSTIGPAPAAAPASSTGPSGPTGSTASS